MNHKYKSGAIIKFNTTLNNKSLYGVIDRAFKYVNTDLMAYRVIADNGVWYGVYHYQIIRTILNG